MRVCQCQSVAIFNILNNKNMKYFKVGQKVWDIRFGEGVVYNIISGGDIFVRFGDILKRYTTDGRWASTEEVSLFQTAPIITPNVPIIEFEQGELVLVRDFGEWLVRYYSHFKNDEHWCFNNQQTKGTVTAWNEIRKLSDNPLLPPK